MNSTESNSAFSRLRAAKKAGQPFVPTPLPRIATALSIAGGGNVVPTYETVIEFSNRTGLPTNVLSALIDSGEITHIRWEAGGHFVQVRKALADLELLELAGRSQKSVA